MELVKITQTAKKLIKDLQTTPSNFTMNIQNSNCLTVGYALRFYLENNQNKYSLRKNFDEDNEDLLGDLDQDLINKKIEEFKCSKEIRTDESYYYYLKYITSCLSTLNAKTQSLKNIIDVVQVFYPYIETNDRFNRILPSQSYLSYIVQNSQDLFSKKEDCQRNSQNNSKKLQIKI